MRQQPASGGYLRLFIVYALLDSFAVGLGMGVPIFAILLGFVVGWFLPRIVDVSSVDLRTSLNKILLAGLLTSGFTFILMAILWGRTVPLLLDPYYDFENFGIPMILFDPRLSFAGWLVLMIVISPSLQLLATVFSSNIVLIRSHDALS